MPYKGKKDKSQDKRIKQLESMVYKTIENKQVNYKNLALAVTSTPVADNSFLQVRTGAEDGSQTGDNARIGNTITLMKQQYRINLVGLNSNVLGSDRWNQFRLIIAESLDGNQPLVASDILENSSYIVDSDLVFSSGYTTRTGTNRRYKVHYDKRFELNDTAGGATRSIKHDVKWKGGKLVEFSGPSPSQVPVNHNMSIIFISDSGVAPHPRAYYSVRSTYKDA